MSGKVIFSPGDLPIQFLQLYGGGVHKKNTMCGGGASEIFYSPFPPEDFKWNSPKINCRL